MVSVWNQSTARAIREQMDPLLSKSNAPIPADSAFDWQGREQITQLHIRLNLTPTKYKSGVNAYSLRGFLWEDFLQRLEKFYVKKEVG